MIKKSIAVLGCVVALSLAHGATTEGSASRPRDASATHGTTNEGSASRPRDASVAHGMTNEGSASRPRDASVAHGMTNVLEEVVVTATPIARTPEAMPASVSVVRADDWKYGGSVTPDELLVRSVGVDLTGNPGANSEPSVNLRGFTTERLTKRVLVLVDGRRTLDLFQGATDFGLLSVDGVDRVEVLRGPASYAYGSGAESGIINIVSRTAKGAPAPFGEIGASYGSDNTYRLRIAGGAAEGDVDAFVALSRFSTDGYLTNDNGDDECADTWNATGNIGWQAGANDEFRFFAGYFESHSTVAYDRESSSDFQNFLWTHVWDSEMFDELSVRLIRSALYHRYDMAAYGYGDFDLNEYTVDVAQRLRIGESVTAVAGVNARRAFSYNRSIVILPIMPPFFYDTLDSSIDFHETTVGAFGEADIEVVEDTILTFGLRYDRIQRFKEQWSPRIGFLQKIGDDVDIYGSVGQAFRTPNISDRYATLPDPNTGNLFVGNPDLKPERLTAYELGTRLRFDDSAKAEATFFYNQLRNGFDYLDTGDYYYYDFGFGPPQPIMPIYQNRNVSKLTTYGLELSGDVALGGGYTVYANYTFTVGKYGRHPDLPINGNELAWLPRQKAGLGLDWSDGKQSHGIMLRYTGQRYTSADNDPQKRLASYATLDWRSRVGLTENFAVTLAINNLLSSKYDVGPADPYSPSGPKRATPGPGIQWYLGAEATF